MRKPAARLKPLVLIEGFLTLPDKTLESHDDDARSPGAIDKSLQDWNVLFQVVPVADAADGAEETVGRLETNTLHLTPSHTFRVAVAGKDAIYLRMRLNQVVERFRALILLFYWYDVTRLLSFDETALATSVSVLLATYTATLRWL